MTTKKASARKTAFGFKAVVVYVERDRTYQPVRHTFQTRDDAVAYAQKWIDANASEVCHGH